jgi:hypothetical protein
MQIAAGALRACRRRSFRYSAMTETTTITATMMAPLAPHILPPAVVAPPLSAALGVRGDRAGGGLMRKARQSVSIGRRIALVWMTWLCFPRP